MRCEAPHAINPRPEALSSIDTARKNQVALEHERLIEPIARMLANRLPTHFDVQDLIQIGRLALLQASERYDSNPEGFISYAKFRIRGAMLDFVRDNYPVRAVAEEPAAAPQNDDAIAVRQALGRLPERERKVLDLTLEDRSQTEIAHELGASQPRVSQLRRSGLKRMAALLVAAMAA